VVEHPHDDVDQIIDPDRLESRRARTQHGKDQRDLPAQRDELLEVEPAAGPVDHGRSQDRVAQARLAHQTLRVGLRSSVAVLACIDRRNRRQVDETSHTRPLGEGQDIACSLDVDALDEGRWIRQHGGRGVNDRAHAGAVWQKRFEPRDVTTDELDRERGKRLDGVVRKSQAAHPERRFDQAPHEELSDIARRAGHEHRPAIGFHRTQLPSRHGDLPARIERQRAV
jgi:hypothetical protein